MKIKSNKPNFLKYNKIEREMYIILFVVILSLIIPLILIPVEKYFNYPYIIEELFKAAVIFFLILKLSSFKSKLITTGLLGFLFAISESIFYIGSNIVIDGDISILAKRLLYTTSLHISTSLLMTLLANKNKKMIIIALLFAILIHYLFNL